MSRTKPRTQDVVREFNNLKKIVYKNSTEDNRIYIKQLYQSIRLCYRAYRGERFAKRSISRWENDKSIFIDFGREITKLFCEITSENPTYESQIFLQRLREYQTDLEGEYRFRLL